MKVDKTNGILREISEETSFLSFTIYDHPKLQEIVDIGNQAIPILLDHLRKSVLAEKAHYRGPYDFNDYAPRYASAALRGITNSNPLNQNTGVTYSKAFKIGLTGMQQGVILSV